MYLNDVVGNAWFSELNALFNELQGTGLVVGPWMEDVTAWAIVLNMVPIQQWILTGIKY